MAINLFGIHIGGLSFLLLLLLFSDLSFFFLFWDFFPLVYLVCLSHCGLIIFFFLKHDDVQLPIKNLAVTSVFDSIFSWQPF